MCVTQTYDCHLIKIIEIFVMQTSHKVENESVEGRDDSELNSFLYSIMYKIINFGLNYVFVFLSKLAFL